MIQLINCFLIYLLIGFLFALLFAFKGVGKIDEEAKDVPLSFRLLIIPGSMAFWPLLLKNWIKNTKK